MNNPGAKNEVFTLVFNHNYYQRGEELNQGSLQIISSPKAKYQQWYWRILEFITFGKRFNSRWEYLVRSIERQPFKMKGVFK